MRLLTLLLVLVTSTALPQSASRVWTSADGRSLEGTLEDLTADQATIRRADGQTFPIPIASLAEEDQAFLKQILADRDRAKGFEEGPFADLITGEWVKVPVEEYGLLFQIYGSKDLKREKELVPLFVHLHGAGARADDVELGKVEIAPEKVVSEAIYKKNPCVVIVPTCPPDVFWGAKVAELEKIIDAAANSLPIDRDRIYLSGYSMGARGIGSLLESRPDKYAAALFADGEANPEWAKTQTAALWMTFSGERDIAKAEATAKAYAEAGKIVHFDPHPDHTHNQIHWTLAKNEEVFDWMFSQRRGQ